MKVVLSPSKSLNEVTVAPTTTFSSATFLNEAQELNEVLKKLAPKELSELMHISEKLANLNWERNQKWALPFNTKNSKQAIYLFEGDVYTGLDAYTIPAKKINYLQDTLRILSGQYGLIKPLDLIQPYRLEMGTKLLINTHSNLYQFWGTKITDKLNEELTEQDVLINLASNEYFKAIHTKSIKAGIITPIFKDFKNGKLKTIAFYAKKARGRMMRFMVDHQITKADELKNFNSDGYQFDEKLSTEKEWVFTR